MTDAAWLSLILIGLLGGLFSGKASPAMCFAGAVIACYLLGLVDISHALISFTNSGLITLVLLILTASVLEKTHLLAKLSQLIAKGSFTSTLVKLGFSTALLSSFTNNTAVVASLIGPIQRNQSHAASKLLLPLNYATILGGTLTLIGTSTNLIVNSFVEHSGLEPLHFFEFTQVGLVLVVAGMALLIVISHWLPERDDNQAETELPFLLEAKVIAGSKLIGKSVHDNQLRALKKLYLAELERNGVAMSPVPPNMVLVAGDKLRFSGAVDSVELLQQFDGLEWFGKHQADGQNLVELVIAPSSHLVGHSLKQVEFREKFSAAVLGIRRGNQVLKGGLGDVKLQSGDLLLVTPGSEFEQQQPRYEFASINALDLSVQLTPKRSHWVMASFAVALGASLLGLVSLAKSLVILLLMYLLTRVLDLEHIRRRFPTSLLIIVGSALCLADLMMSTGLATELSNGLMSLFSGYGTLGAFIGVYLMTVLLTELITNNAAAALAFPIALAISETLGVDAKPFIIAVVFGASASFISPYGYQTNLMVFNAGNYRFIDFVKLGLPLSLLYSTLVIILVPMWFPLN
ncbi:SLC13 family permease [Shewanella sp. OPT22]|nr:SLC13 family permease [Shewanella sp. OPT22]